MSDLTVHEVPPPPYVIERRVMIDTNVVLDLLLEREPYVDAAHMVFDRLEAGWAKGHLCATTITTLDYLMRRTVGGSRSRELIGYLLATCRIAPVTHVVLQAAIALPMSDYEDAVLAAAALGVGVQHLVTRNPRDFAKSGLRLYTPQEWLAAEP